MPQNAASDQGLHCLLTDCSIKIQIKMKKISPHNILNGHGLLQLIREGNWIRHIGLKMVNFIAFMGHCIHMKQAPFCHNTILILCYEEQ